MFDEGVLDRMALTVRPETLDRGDGPPVLHDGEGQAGHDALSIGQHGAGAALAEAAALLGARRVQHIPPDIPQRRSRRTEERRVGKEGGRTWRIGGAALY